MIVSSGKMAGSFPPPDSHHPPLSSSSHAGGSNPQPSAPPEWEIVYCRFSIPLQGKAGATGESSPKWHTVAKTKESSEAEELERFDSYYGEKGKVYIFPDVAEPKAKVYQKIKNSQPQESDEEQENLLPEDPDSYTVNTEKWNRSKNEGEEEGQLAEIDVVERIKAALEKIDPPDDSPVFLLYNQDLDKIQDPGEEQKSEVKQKVGKRRVGEIDALLLHPVLGVLLLEVKANRKYNRRRLHDATQQLLCAQAFIQQEMEDLLEKDAIVLTIAQPYLEEVQKTKPPRKKSDASVQRMSSAGEPVITSATRTAEQATFPSTAADARPARKAIPAFSRAPPAATPATDVTPSMSRQAGEQGGACNKSGKEEDAKKVERLEDHPEIKRIQGSKSEVFEGWVKVIQEHRNTSGHAFKGFTAEARLRNFKLACIRRCSIAGLHPGKSVKASADLHHRFLLTKEQLSVRDSQAELLHITGPYGSGKTLLLAERARRWLGEGRRVALAVRWNNQDVLLQYLVNSVCKDKDKVSSHRNYSDLLKKLDTASSDDRISVIADELLPSDEFYSTLLDNVRKKHVRGLWTANIQPLSDQNKKALEELNGTTIPLTECLRCPPHVGAWTKRVRNENDPELKPPYVPIMRELSVDVEVIRHPDHSQSQPREVCSPCKEGVKAIFSGLGLLGETAKSALSHSDVIVLTTDEFCDRKHIACWLRDLGLPAVAERDLWRQDDPVLPPGATQRSRDQQNVEAKRNCILTGKDVEGKALIPVVMCEDFQGLEKPVVLLWHEDWNDVHGHSLEQEDVRMFRHRYLWFLAASRCQGRLVALAATPSPLLPLLPASCPPEQVQERPPELQTGDGTARTDSVSMGETSASPAPLFSPASSSSLEGDLNPRPSTQPEESINLCHGTAEDSSWKASRVTRGKPSLNIEVFDKVYNKKGKVLLFPDFVQHKVTLYKKVTPARPRPPADAAREAQASSEQRTPSTATENSEGQTSNVATASQLQGEQKEISGSCGNLGKTLQIKYTAAEAIDFSSKENVEVVSGGKDGGSEEKPPKKIRRKVPSSFFLDVEKWKNSKILEHLEAEDCEFLVVQRIKAALEDTADPDDPPVFLLHNQNLSSKAASNKSGEKDILVLNPHLGVLLLEVKAVKNKDAFSRFDEATAQLLHAKESIQKEMGDLLEKHAVVLAIALPLLEPEDSSNIRQKAQERLSTKPCSDVAAAVPTLSVTSLTAKEPARGKRAVNPKIKEGALLANHPEIHLVCGSTAEVITQWVRRLQHLRATASHAFKGSTAEERVESFKEACIRRCSVAGLRPGQSVKASAALHRRFLLIEEQLSVRDSQAELLHMSGPHGSGKTLLLAERARRWLQEGRRLALAVGWSNQDVLLHNLVLGTSKDLDRVSTYRGCNDLLEKLNTISTEDPISIIMDEAAFHDASYSRLMDHVTAGRVRGLWTARTTPLSDEHKRKLQSLRGSTVQLSVCLRCPAHVMAWANSVRGINDLPLLPPPVPIIQELGVGVEVISHADHGQSQSSDSCSTCKGAAKAFFPNLGLLGQHATSALSFSDVVVLTTDEFCDRRRVAAWLRNLGLHAVAEREQWRYDNPVLAPGVTPTSSGQAEVESLRSRILEGKDVNGAPVIQVVYCQDFQGLEKPVVLLWHEDWDDVDKSKQSQEDRDDRLSRHRYSWFVASTRCQGRLAALVITPSPLLPMLPATSPPKSSRATASSASCVTSASPASHHSPVSSSSLGEDSNPRPSTPPEWEFTNAAGHDLKSNPRPSSPPEKPDFHKTRRSCPLL